MVHAAYVDRATATGVSSVPPPRAANSSRKNVFGRGARPD
jgi:hypothetical protein